MQSQELLLIADAIDGEINRMCITDDLEELDTMALHALKNIKKLQSIRYKDIKGERAEA